LRLVKQQNNLTRIGLISDTHGFLDENIFKHIENCDEIGHAGDFGTRVIAEQIKSKIKENQITEA
jgi:uncharacterized protein